MNGKHTMIFGHDGTACVIASSTDYEDYVPNLYAMYELAKRHNDDLKSNHSRK